MEKVTIIIPAYNEEKRIGNTLEKYGSFFSNLKDKNELNVEILIVINNTRDKTEEIVRKYKKKYPIIKYLNFKRGGKGFAIIEGFKEALKDKKNTLIGFVDADLATGPESFYELVRNINGSGGIIASRYVNGAIVKPKQKITRIIASRVFNIILRLLFMFPYRDTQCGAKLFRKEVIKKIIPNLGVTEWAFDVDLLYNVHKLGFKIKELPTTWSDIGGSKINLKKSSLQMFLAVMRLRLVNSKFARFAGPFKFLVRPIWKLVK